MGPMECTSLSSPHSANKAAVFWGEVLLKPAIKFPDQITLIIKLTICHKNDRIGLYNTHLIKTEYLFISERYQK